MKRLLLVDDDPDILDALAAVLEETYEVALAKNGEVALEVLRSQHVDAVILDLMMPVMDGATFMRHFHERGLEVPVIIVSAGTNLHGRARELRAFDWLAKPFDVSVLEEKLARALSGPGGSSPPPEPDLGSGPKPAKDAGGKGGKGAKPQRAPELRL